MLPQNTSPMEVICELPVDGHFLHDFAGSAGRVCNMAEMIVRKYRASLGDEAVSLFDLLSDCAVHLRGLIGGLETYTRILGSASVFRLAKGDELLAAALAMSGPAVSQAGVSLTRDPLPEFYCDTGQITYLFASLIENSLKFRRGDHLRLHVSAEAAGENWLFSIEDDGIGIDPSESEGIFRLFGRVHGDDYPGAGVGLAIARQIVRRHSGSIWCESQPGNGSCFRFTLPQRGPLEVATSNWSGGARKGAS